MGSNMKHDSCFSEKYFQTFCLKISIGAFSDFSVNKKDVAQFGCFQK